MVENMDNLSKEQLVLLVKEMNNKMSSLQAEVNFYREQISLANKKTYGRSSEKTDEQQLTFWSRLFNETETLREISDHINTEEESKKHAKKGPNKNHITKGAVAKESDVHHDLGEDEKTCATCGESLRCIGEELAYVEMVYHPGYYEKINHFQKAYVCSNNCLELQEGPHGETQVIKAQLPNKLLPKSSASASLLAKIIYDKYEKALPLYRQETEYKNVGFDLSRQTMSNWIMKADELYVSHMIDHMKQRLDNSHLVLLDETRVEVINHPDKDASKANAYMWVARTGPYEPDPIIVFEYKRGRNHEYAYEIAPNSKAIIQSDGYEAYDKLKNTHIGCWAHCRRKYTDVLDSIPRGVKQKDTTAYELKAMIDKMFAIERKGKDKSIEERVALRQEKTKAIMNQFFEKVHDCYELLGTMPTTESFKKAITYTINQEKKLRLVLEYGEADLSTNAIERTIRNFTVGRNNWLFFNSEYGAKSGADMYSLIVTAKENGLKAYDYLEYIFEKLPNINAEDSEELEKIMPWSKELPSSIKKTQK